MSFRLECNAYGKSHLRQWRRQIIAVKPYFFCGFCIVKISTLPLYCKGQSTPPTHSESKNETRIIPFILLRLSELSKKFQMTQEEIATNLEVTLKPEYIVGLSILATVGLVTMWWMFWRYVSKSNENIFDIIKSPATFKIITVMGVVAATVVLSLAGRLEGNITGAILSGIVGYVLGQLSLKKEEENKGKN